eukprot:1887589-Pleurochrysis_carterae.AAC.1
MLAVAASQPLSAFAAPVPVPQMDDKTLQQELVSILRVQEAAAQEARLVKTGKYRELQRLNVKRAVGMMIDNYDLSGRFVRASAVAPRDKANAAASFGNTAVESLVQILEYFQVDLVANELTKEQQTFVLKALKSTSTSIDSFLALMPSNVVAAAKKQIEEENELNLKEFPDDAYLNPTPTVGELLAYAFVPRIQADADDANFEFSHSASMSCLLLRHSGSAEDPYVISDDNAQKHVFPSGAGSKNI